MKELKTSIENADEGQLAFLRSTHDIRNKQQMCLNIVQLH